MGKTQEFLHKNAYGIHKTNVHLKVTIHLFVHCAVCLTTGPQPLPKRVLHTVRSSASSFNFQYPLFSSRSCSSCSRLLLRLPVTSIVPYICPSAHHEDIRGDGGITPRILKAALAGGEWSASRPGHFIPLSPPVTSLRYQMEAGWVTEPV